MLEQSFPFNTSMVLKKHFQKLGPLAELYGLLQFSWTFLFIVKKIKKYLPHNHWARHELSRIGYDLVVGNGNLEHASGIGDTGGDSDCNKPANDRREETRFGV